MKRLTYLLTLFCATLFDGVTTVTSSSLGFIADPEWAGINEHEF